MQFMSAFTNAKDFFLQVQLLKLGQVHPKITYFSPRIRLNRRLRSNSILCIIASHQLQNHRHS